MAGHSKWANIKHRKGRQDALRGKINTKLIREITVSAKQAGGDPDSNPRLRLAIDKANRANVTKDSIKKAIDKGTGVLAGEDYTEVVYEGYAPGGVALMVMCLTDNKNRTVAEVRHAFAKHGGNLGTDGSVAYLFERKAVIELACSQEEQEALMEACLEYAVEDVVPLDDCGVQLLLAPADLETVSAALQKNSAALELAELRMCAQTLLELPEDAQEKLMTLEEALEDLDDVQAVYHNAVMH